MQLRMVMKMPRMLLGMSFLTVMLCLAGCPTPEMRDTELHDSLRRDSVGHVGCDESEIHVMLTSVPGETTTWIATCPTQNYYCSQTVTYDGPGPTSCAPFASQQPSSR
jgi:hypothetical protein